ncbi:MAG: hypothetical protein KGI54_06300 [Pseudomonadota bacterium]|nr:hypothetical protein [Pseudomonadota bacterium]
MNSHAGKGIRSAESMGLERLRRELNRVRMERSPSQRSQENGKWIYGSFG